MSNRNKDLSGGDKGALVFGIFLVLVFLVRIIYEICKYFF